MKKKFKTTKFPSDEFRKELLTCALPYQGNVTPINQTLNVLNGSPDKCKTVLFERDYVDKDYQDEYAAFYSRAFKKYEPRATRLHFFAADFSDADISKLAAKVPKDSYLGSLVIRPIDLQRVGRTLLRPIIKNPNLQFVHCLAEFDTHILGQEFTVKAMPFTQQDTQVGACAQASLWMVARYLSRRFGHREFLPAEINALAKSQGGMGRALPAELGLNWKQILDALEGMGLSAWSYSISQFDDCSAHIDQALPEPRKASQKKKKEHHECVRILKLADIAYRYIESGLPVIFGTNNHALVGIGHTYDPSAKAKVAIQRIPAFIVHNDNTGPYGTMPLFTTKGHSGLTFDKVEDIIAVVPPEVTLRAEAAEVRARGAIQGFLNLKTNNAAIPTYADIIFRLRPDLKNLLNQLEFRTFLIPSVDFQKKLREDATNGRFNALVANRLIELDYPKFIWVTEISSSALLNSPHRDKRKCLGRVIIDSTAPARTRGEMVVHFCDFLGMLDRQNNAAPPWEHVPNTTPFGHQISR
jgi:hypothetical protein